MRLIDADKLRKNFAGGDEYKSISESIHDEIFVGAIDAAPTVNPYEWVSAKDKLPDEFKTVLALCKDGGMFVGRYTSWHRWEIFTAMKLTRVVSRTVTHWMPLPALPVEKES